MSATPPSDTVTNPPETITGDYMVMAVVTAPGHDGSTGGGTTEEEFVIGETMGDVDLNKDPEVAETTLHENEIIQQREKHFSLTVEFTLAAVEGQPQLETLKLYEPVDSAQGDSADGSYIGPSEWDALRVYIYDEEPDLTVPAQDSWEFWGVEVSSELGSYSPGDTGEIPISGLVNGGHRHGNSKPTP